MVKNSKKLNYRGLQKKEREFYDKIADCTQLGALTLVYDWRNAGMIDLYELEHLIVAIVKGGYNH